jgi:GTP diphosphokinase / guanosine-3',5'-bis(diphosphate) 3'-diphosphatase
MIYVDIETLIKDIRTYNACEEDIIRKAYDYANILHKGQTRQSGEEYITHPLSVALILSEMRADRDTICAALLHDVIEDTHITKEDIISEFNLNIANLVDGVTKISKMNFSSKADEKATNTRKIITSINEDVRIIIIKLADRLHNMRTLEFKSEFKQKENALETMEIYVPLAYYIGAYRIKSELEDLSLKYLKPDVYNDIENKIIEIRKVTDEPVRNMLNDISNILNNENIPHEIKKRTKNIYGVYKNFLHGKRLNEIHDFLSLKIQVDTIKNCYITLGVIHEHYHPLNSKFKDYIFNPKTNLYRSIHTTVFGDDEHLIQTQIRTFDMDKIASFGLTAYWDINKGLASSTMQEDLKTKFQFFKSLSEINSMTSDNIEFVNQVKKELFNKNIYVYTPKGDTIELPFGSTPIDFAYRIHSDVGNTMVGAIVNDKYVPIDYQLQNKDRIKIITDKLAYGPKSEWFDKAHTSLAKRKIKEFNHNII